MLHQLTPLPHNPAPQDHTLHSSGTLTVQAPLVAHRCHAYWRIGFLQKYTPMQCLFKYRPFLPLSNLLHHFVASIQTIACASFAGNLPPYCPATLLQHDLRRSLHSKHDFIALTHCLLSNLSTLGRKCLWLPAGLYLVDAQQSKLCLKSKPRFRYNSLYPASVNKMIRLQQPFLTAADTGPASHHARLQENLGGGASATYSLAQLNKHLVAESLEQEKDSVFRYAAHVEGVDPLTYPSPAHIH